MTAGPVDVGIDLLEIDRLERAELDVNVRVSLTHTRRDAAAVAILV